MGWSFIAPKAADLRSLPVAASVSAALTPVAAQALEMPEAGGMILGYIFCPGLKKSLKMGLL